MKMNRSYMKQKKAIKSGILYQCDFLIQMLLDTKENVLNNHIHKYNLLTLNELVFKLTTDSQLPAQAVLEISAKLEL